MDDFLLFLLLVWAVGVLSGWWLRGWWLGRPVQAFDIGIEPVTLRAFAALNDRIDSTDRLRTRRHHHP